MYTRMLSFGRIRGFVFGSWGEVSDDVRSFIKLVASQSATKIWRSIDKARSIAEVQGVIKTRLRRILGITAVRSAQFLKTQRSLISLAIFNDLGKDLPKLDPSLKLGVQNTTPILVRVPGELALPFSNFW